jgi:hypothetical protein
MQKEARPARWPGVESDVTWPGLTVEAVIYAALLAGAAFVRLYDLGRWPLLAVEAETALAAWRFLHAQGVTGNPPPFLFLGALAGFFAFGAGDGVARLVPALLGTGLVLLPLALRRRLGTWGALAVAFFLAFSPTLVFYSRTLSGPVPALAGLGAVLVAAEWASRQEVERARALGAAGLAVALTSSPWVYTFLLAALLFAFLGWLARRQGSPWPGWAAGEEVGRTLFRDRRAWGMLAVPLALISTAFFMRATGVQATADLLAAWLGRVVPGSMGQAWGYALGILAFYELGVLLLGVGGLVAGLRQRNPWAGFLGLWALVALLLTTLSGARDAGPVVLALLPLALLAGLAVTVIVSRLRPARWAWVGGCLAVLSTLLGFWWLQLAGYGNVAAGRAFGVSPVLVAALLLVTPLVIVGAGLILYFSLGRAETVWALTILGMGLAASFLLRQSISLNFVYARDAREPLVVSPTSVDLKDMTAFLRDWSVRTAMDKHALAITVGADLEPLVTWYLREFAALRVRPSPLADTQAGAIVVRAGPGRPVSAGYARQRYRLLTHSDAPLGTGLQALSWWLLRTGGGHVQAETCELWIKP